MIPAGYNPFTAEPYLHSVSPRTHAPPNPLLLANGWPPLLLAANPKAVIPGVSTNAVGKNYRVLHKIGMGSFGEIYLGVDIRTNERIAIKVENRTTKYPQLMEEYQVYRAVAKGVGVPAAIWCGSNSNVHIMVMELLGDSLETLYNLCNRKFSLKTITMLAIQLLNRIEHHHSCNYLHRDIKPDNFLMGPPQSPNAHLLYMVDMGLCKKYRDENTLHHIPYRENKKLIGTPRYASINTHLGIEQCRRDDLESIGYMLIYFFAGKLPWQGLKARNKQEKYDKISQSKMAISIETLCKGAPPAFKTYLEYCRQLRFTQKPDYKYLRSLFYDLFKQNGWKDDCVYDWMMLKLDSQTLPYNVPTAAELATAAAARASGGNGSSLMASPAQPSLTPMPSQTDLSYQMQMMQYHAQQQALQAQHASAMQMAAQRLMYTPPTAAAAAAATATTPRATPTPPAVQQPSVTEEVRTLRARVSALEAQLNEQRNAANEWKTLWEKERATTTQVQRQAVSLRETVLQLQQQMARQQQQQQQQQIAAAAAAAAAPNPDVIPLASAASLKRRRTPANSNDSGDRGDSVELGQQEDGTETKKPRRGGTR